MDQTTLLTIFVALAAFAMLIQAFMLVAIFVVSKRTQDKVIEFLPHATELTHRAHAILIESQRQIAGIGTKSNDILESTKVQLAKFDELFSDVSTRAKVQIERAEMVLDDTMTRTQETVALLQRGVIAPIREVHGVMSGFRAAFSHLSRSRRPTVDHVTADEEMFI